MNHSSGRGMIKWAPFQSLHEQSSYLGRMRENRSKVERPLLSVDKQEEINRILCEYHGEEVCLTYYEDGHIKNIEGVILGIDTYSKRLRIKEKNVRFQNVLDLIEL